MSIYRQMIMNRPMMKLMEEFLSQQTRAELFSPEGLEQLIRTGRETKRRNSPVEEPEQILTRRNEHENK